MPSQALVSLLHEATDGMCSHVLAVSVPSQALVSLLPLSTIAQVADHVLLVSVPSQALVSLLPWKLRLTAECVLWRFSAFTGFGLSATRLGSNRYQPR